MLEGGKEREGGRSGEEEDIEEVNGDRGEFECLGTTASPTFRAPSFLCRRRSRGRCHVRCTGLWGGWSHRTRELPVGQRAVFRSAFVSDSGSGAASWRLYQLSLTRLTEEVRCSLLLESLDFSSHPSSPCWVPMGTD